MNKEIIYSMNTAYRGEYEIQGFSYGSGEKTAAATTPAIRAMRDSTSAGAECVRYQVQIFDAPIPARMVSGT